MPPRLRRPSNTAATTSQGLIAPILRFCGHAFDGTLPVENHLPAAVAPRIHRGAVRQGRLAVAFRRSLVDDRRHIVGDLQHPRLFDADVCPRRSIAAGCRLDRPCPSRPSKTRPALRPPCSRGSNRDRPPPPKSRAPAPRSSSLTAMVTPPSTRMCHLCAIDFQAGIHG